MQNAHLKRLEGLIVAGLVGIAGGNRQQCNGVVWLQLKALLGAQVRVCVGGGGGGGARGSQNVTWVQAEVGIHIIICSVQKHWVCTLAPSKTGHSTDGSMPLSA